MAAPGVLMAQDTGTAIDTPSSAQEVLNAAMRPPIFPHIYNVAVPTENPCRTNFFVYQIGRKQTKIDVIFDIDWSRVTSIHFVEGKDQTEVWWTNWISLNYDDNAYVPVHVAKDQIENALKAAVALKNACSSKASK